MNDLIWYLLNFALAHDINYELQKLPPYFESRALPESDLIIINTGWHNTNEIPFTIGHEIGHIMNHDNISKCQPQTANYPLELAADKYSLNLIFKYTMKMNLMIREPQTFIEQFGIPERMLIPAAELFKQNYESIF